jgi:hypothetical protein
MTKMGWNFWLVWLLSIWAVLRCRCNLVEAVPRGARAIGSPKGAAANTTSGRMRYPPSSDPVAWDHNSLPRPCESPSTTLRWVVATSVVNGQARAGDLAEDREPRVDRGVQAMRQKTSFVCLLYAAPGGLRLRFRHVFAGQAGHSISLACAVGCSTQHRIL